VGYTHYWFREEEINEEFFGRITADFERIILPLDNAGVRLAGPCGTGLPEIFPSRISFNGIEARGHARNPNIYIPFPTDEASGIGDSRNAIARANSLFVRLRRRTCDGSCNYESFLLEQSMKSSVFPRQEDGRYLCFCTTAFKPYDLAVQCLLLIAKHHLGGQIHVSFQGSNSLWNGPRAFCYVHLGYPLGEFHMEERRGPLRSEDRQKR
jgi:hypothetical protein